MSITIDMSERQLRLSVLKLALALVGLFALLAVGFSLLADRAQNVAVPVLLVSVAFGFVTNGCLAVLKIIDWFEERKQRNG